MGFFDFITGRKTYKMQDLYDVSAVYEEEIKKIKRLKNREKKKKRERRMREKLKSFFKDLDNLGIEVYLDKEDGKGRLKDKHINKMDLMMIHKKYIVTTLIEIEKEIDKRQKEKEKK